MSILTEHDMLDWHSSYVLIAESINLSKDTQTEVFGPSKYQRLVGKLNYT